MALLVCLWTLMSTLMTSGYQRLTATVRPGCSQLIRAQAGDRVGGVAEGIPYRRAAEAAPFFAEHDVCYILLLEPGGEGDVGGLRVVPRGLRRHSDCDFVYREQALTGPLRFALPGAPRWLRRPGIGEILSLNQLRGPLRASWRCKLRRGVFLGRKTLKPLNGFHSGKKALVHTLSRSDPFGDFIIIGQCYLR